MPKPGAASMIARLASAPARCPADLGRPRDVAQRPLPSVIMATWSEASGLAGGALRICCKTTCWTAMLVPSPPRRPPHLQMTLYNKVRREKKLAARSPDQRLHMVQVALERLPARRCQPVLRFRQPPVKRFLAEDVIRLLQLARVHAQIAVGRLQQSFQLIERQRAVYRQRAHNAQPD